MRMLRLPSGGLDTRLLVSGGSWDHKEYVRRMKSSATARVDVDDDGNENDDDEE